MATPLTPISLRGPGRFGLNVSQAVGADDPRWALELTNAVFDDAGRIAARNGLNNLTATGGHAADTLSVWEYIKDKDTKEIISAAGAKLYRGTTTITDVTGLSEGSSASWDYANFNGQCIAVQQGQPPIKYSGTSFATFGTTGAPPLGDAVLSAWGRLWITDEDRQGVSWSALLDEETWSGAGTGNIGLENYWPDGLDLTVGLQQWQDRLLVFGERSILVFTGLDDPENDLALVDILDSGAVGRDAIVTVGNDLMYLSREGIRSINRAIQFSNLPSAMISTNVRDQLVMDIASTSDYHMCYSETVGGILAKIGVSYWYFDVKLPTEQGDLRASQWTGIAWKSCHAATDGTIYLGNNGGVGDYSGFADEGSAYLLRYRGTWLDNNGQTIIPKRARVAVVTTTSMNVTMVWGFDFIDSLNQETRNTGETAALSEWSLGEWGLNEWSGANTQVRRLAYNLSSEGERVQVGITVEVTGKIAIEQIDLYSKIGRIAA